ncbi:thiamine pyrophosphate-binding protein [Marivibrio halodurans]|uniref:Thiamine pyrophosphate-binding protein n=1 Tax=Marivibrio halodurans TaxID=2039722 RepID=A0A8J7V3B8_9PROT|nr:thiamine pyrophosphate-binding protein [Marivibrio halodurans]MBP5857787.1 thiamine pyrophosphate-binding protein [Marivibrio halodurans]
MERTVSAADMVARYLAAAGCRHAFGIPGGEVVSVVDALDRAGIAFHLAKHENAAGFMAEGTWHMTGAPGVLVATLGPGVTNAVTAIANAWQDRVPLIVLTGCVEAAEALTYTHQVLDHQALLRPVTKASFRLADGAVGELMEKALAIAMGRTGDGRPGPVHIDLPIDLARAPREWTGAAYLRGPQGRTAPAGPDLERARSWLAEAAAPIAIVGLDVLNHGAEQAVADFCRRFGMPLITSYKAKGVLAEDDPLSLGGAGLSPVADGHLHGLLGEADLILLLGYDPIEMRAGWRDPWHPDRQRVIEIAAEGNTHSMHRASLSFVCDIGAGVEALAAAGPARARVWEGGGPARVRAALRQAFGADEAWGPAAVVDTARKTLPRGAVATVDSGAHRILLSQIWQCEAPRGLLQSTGLCTMGGALPLAIGARKAAPERPVVCFTGDAGLEMVLGELASARELETPVVVVVFADNSLALIEMKQRGAGLANLGVDYGGSDFAAIAAAMGGVGVEVDNRADLADALRGALVRDRFTVIAARIDRKAYDGRI